MRFWEKNTLCNIIYVIRGRSSHPIYSASAYWSIDSYEVQYDTISNSCSRSASYVGSGAAQFKQGTWVITGIGDLINTMLTASIAVLLILLIEERVGSMALIVFRQLLVV